MPLFSMVLVAEAAPTLSLAEAEAAYLQALDEREGNEPVPLPAVALRDQPALRWLSAAASQTLPANPFPKGGPAWREAEGVRESARVGISYQPTQRLTGRVAVGAERADGAQRVVAVDEAYSLDVGGAYRVARHIDVTAGARYRISRDRLDPTGAEARRDSQAVYIGTAFRF